MNSIEEVYESLTPEEQHRFLIKTLERQYDFGFEGSSLQMCKKCHVRAFERGGLGCDIDKMCEECYDTFCGECSKLEGEHDVFDRFYCKAHIKSRTATAVDSL